MKFLILISISLFILASCKETKKSPTALAHSKKIKEQATEMAQLLLKKDFKEFIKFTHPKIISLMGGADKMTYTLTNSVLDLENEGTRFMTINFEEPGSVITVADELQCTIVQKLEMKVPKGKVLTRTTLIAISKDNGLHWYFLDSGGKDIKSMKDVLPNLSSELEIIKKEDPVFTND
jgi:hypothetical protein